MLECCSSENSQMCHEIVKFSNAKATKIIKVLHLLRNADVSIKNAIKLEKVELENSL